MSLGSIKALIVEIIKSFKWILLKYSKFKKVLINKYFFDKVEIFNFTSWHIGYKYLLAYKGEEKYFIKIDSEYKIIQNEYLASGILRNKNNKSKESFSNVFEYGHINGDDFVIMEFIIGETLEDILKGNSALDKFQLNSIINQLIGILNMLHCSNIIHRDIRPANFILQNKEDNKLNIVLIDFTFAISLEDERFKEINKNDLNIRLLEQLGANYKKDKKIWDDTYSITKIIKELDSAKDLSSDIYESLRKKENLITYSLGDKW